MRRPLGVSLAAALLMSTPPAAWAATITGIITGPDGAPFRAAFVRVQNMKTHMTVMVLSDSQGRYWTDKLDPGTYEVWATWVGYRSDPVRRRNVALADGSRVSLNFTMKN